MVSHCAMAGASERNEQVTFTGRNCLNSSALVLFSGAKSLGVIMLRKFFLGGLALVEGGEYDVAVHELHIVDAVVFQHQLYGVEHLLLLYVVEDEGDQQPLADVRAASCVARVGAAW